MSKACTTCVSGNKSFSTLLASSSEFKNQLSVLSADKVASAKHQVIVVPDVFDGRVVWANFLPSIKNQGKCGSCWAFAGTDALSARIALATNGKYKPNLSPASMVYCNLGGDYEYEEAIKLLGEGKPYDYTPDEMIPEMRKAEIDAVKEHGCQGETLIGTWQYLFRFGATEESCAPYGTSNNFDLKSFGSNGEPPACIDVFGAKYDVCPNGGGVARWHRSKGYYKVDSNEAAIRRDIYHWGPATTGFTIHEDFMKWDGKNPAVYKWDGEAAEIGGHAVVIVGWGADHWIVKNSWSEKWGDGGYFKIAKGNNECGIEENVIVGFPELHGYRNYMEAPLLRNDKDLFLRAAWNVADSGVKITTIKSMLVGDVDLTAANIDGHIYDSKYWPDLSTFIAGEPSKTTFPLNRSFPKYLAAPRNDKEKAVSTSVIVGLSIAVVATAVILLSRKKIVALLEKI